MTNHLLHAHNAMTHSDSGSATFELNVDENTNLFTLSAAVCSKKDQFSRKYGRALANTRLVKKDTITGYFHPSYSMRMNVALAVRDYLYDRANEANPERDPKFRLYEKAYEAVVASLQS